MTNYNWKEFQQWLEEDPTRKKGLDWNSSFSHWQTNPDNFNILVRASKGELTTGVWTSFSHKPNQEVVKKWLKDLESKNPQKAKELEEQLRQKEQTLNQKQTELNSLNSQLTNLQNKLTHYLTQRKTQINQELTLIREVLN